MNKLLKLSTVVFVSSFALGLCSCGLVSKDTQTESNSSEISEISSIASNSESNATNSSESTAEVTVSISSEIDPANNTLTTETTSYADGFYECAIYGDSIVEVDGVTSITIDIKSFVTFDDAYVSSIVVGDTIDLEQYGYVSIIVTSTDIVEVASGYDYIPVDNGEYVLTYNPDSGVWDLVGSSDTRVSYISESVTLELSSDCLIRDGFTPIVLGSGNYEPIILPDIQTFFDSIGQDHYDWCDVTVSNGEITEIKFNFHP
jgi:hypothetical protein